MACYENTKSDSTNYDEGAERAYLGDTIMEKAIKVVEWLMKYGGYTKFQAAAMAGVAMQESKFKTSILNSSTGATGLFQWIPKYHKSMLRCAGWPEDTKMASLSLEQQVKFECDYLKSTCGHNNKANELLKSTGNLHDALCVFGSFNTVPGAFYNDTKFSRIPSQKEASFYLHRAVSAKKNPSYEEANKTWNLYWPYAKQVWNKVKN